MVTYTRKILLVINDFLLINVAAYAALLIRFEGIVPQQFLAVYLHSFLALTALKLLIYYLFGLYRSLWRYASISELIQIFLGTVSGAVAAYAFGFVTGLKQPRSLYIMTWLITFLLVGASRLSYRVIRRIKHYYSFQDIAIKRIMIVGAGEAGSMVIKELKNHSSLGSMPVVAVDDNKWKLRSKINGVPILGDRTKIKELAERFNIEEIIVSIPSARKSELSEILKICKETRCKLKTLPGVYELINGKVSIKNIRDVSIEDLLGRDEVELDTAEIAGYLKDETVLVTGGGGSIGSELCRQIAGYKPRKLIILDIYENSTYDLQNELSLIYKNKLDLEVVIGSVREIDRLRQVFEKYRPSVVFHAAAHKHVPLMESNPAEAVKNNVFGTLNTARCADEFGAKKFVLISTDKAVNPTNIMGATKRLAEMVIQSLDRQSATEFVAVRFGNVLGSNGSVIPLFKKQIAQGGPVTVTHPEIIRYFMTIPEAAQLVIQAGAMAKGGEIFVLDMGEPVKIDDLARDLIRFSGFEPDVDIKIEYTGLRPGEKLYEELMLEEEGIRETVHEKIYIAKPLNLSYQEVLERVKALEGAIADADKLKECMMAVVPTYQPLGQQEAAAAIEVSQ